MRVLNADSGNQPTEDQKQQAFQKIPIDVDHQRVFTVFFYKIVCVRRSHTDFLKQFFEN
jgi:hypothetical protein